MSEFGQIVCVSGAQRGKNDGQGRARWQTKSGEALLPGSRDTEHAGIPGTKVSSRMGGAIHEDHERWCAPRSGPTTVDFPIASSVSTEPSCNLRGDPHEVRSLVQDLHLGERVSFVSFGPGQRSELGDLVSGSHVVALLSDHQAHPVAIREAVALGVPIVQLLATCERTFLCAS